MTAGREKKNREEQRNNSDLQMRLTRRIPSVSLPPCQAKISGLALQQSEKAVSEDEKKRKAEEQSGEVTECSISWR